MALLAGLTGLLVAVPAASAPAAPTAVVGMGDSAMSGESAGSYERGTDQPGNFCHRSRRALIHETTIPDVTKTLNLACSGAQSANLYIGGPSQNGEPAQSTKLRRAARANRIRLVVVEVGANDDPQFARAATTCVAAFVLRTPACRAVEDPTWAARVAAMVPKVERALDDVRTVMRRAGYADRDWQAVVASYWSPVDTPIRYSGYLAKLKNGCPMYNADMRWGHDTAVPVLGAALRGVATRKGWRFLDFSGAMDGRQVCASGITHAQEWTTGLKYDPTVADWYSFDAVRQSFHVNARGHRELGRCLTEFAATSARAAACRRGADGALHAVG